MKVDINITPDMYREDRSKYLKKHGPSFGTGSPLGAVAYCVDIGRQLGKTHNMIMSFPAEGKFFVVGYRRSTTHEIRNETLRLRPDIDIRNMIGISYQTMDEELERHSQGALPGVHAKIPVYVDNSVLDEIQYGFVVKLNRGN